jgi:hypothetical protein
VPARNRALWLTLAALAAPIPAFALSGEDGAGQVDAGPAALSVSSSLGSCGVMNNGIACQVNVSFNALPNATSYTATITSPDGSVTDLGGVAPGGTSAWVPYVGAGTYSVSVTAYGTPIDPTEDSDGEPHVIATGVSPPGANDAQPRVPENHSSDAEAGSADGNGSGHGDGNAGVEAGSADDSATCDPTLTPPTVTPDPSTTTPTGPTGATGPTGPTGADGVDAGAAGKRGVEAAAAGVTLDNTTSSAPDTSTRC